MMGTYPGSEGSDGSGPNYADMYAGASSTERDHATPEEARRLADDVARLPVTATEAECERALRSLAAQLEAAQKEIVRLNEDLEGANESIDNLLHCCESAEKVIEALRAYRDEPLKANEPIDQGWANLLAALAAYDEQVKP